MPVIDRSDIPECDFSNLFRYYAILLILVSKEVLENRLYTRIRFKIIGLTWESPWDVILINPETISPSRMSNILTEAA